jgi:hypothetical protein
MYLFDANRFSKDGNKGQEKEVALSFFFVKGQIPVDIFDRPGFGWIAKICRLISKAAKSRDLIDRFSKSRMLQLSGLANQMERISKLIQCRGNKISSVANNVLICNLRLRV